MFLSSSMRLAIPTGSTEVSFALLTPLDHLVARICTCPDTLPTSGRVFSWSPRSPFPRRSPLVLDPSTSLTLSGPRSMSTFPIPLPCSWYGCILTLRGHFAVVCGPWANPLHGHRPQAPVATLANRRTVTIGYDISRYGMDTYAIKTIR